MSGETIAARDCCFSPSDELMPVDEAMARIKDSLSIAVGTENAPLAEALDRVLAEDLVAPMSVPPHDNSAVDGYAVHFDDLSRNGETRLPVTARIAAGHPLDRAAVRGESLRIFTGAPMPDGADTVIMQEDTEADGNHVIIRPGVKKGANRRRAGEDVTEGATILRRGIRLRAQELGLAASVGCSTLSVRRQLRTAVFSTGDEVRDPGATLPPGGIFDSNRYTVMSLLRGLGCAVTDLGILPDNLDTIRNAIDAAADDHDLIITSGGVSLGEEDHVKAAVEALGALTFWRLAIKPGRPIALGQVRNVPFIGLPGNPVAAMVTFMCIGRPVVLRLAGRNDDDPATFRVPAGFSFDKKAGRREWVRARLERTPDGLHVMKFRSEGSGILSSMVESDGLVVLSEGTEAVREGDLVDFLPFREVTR
ncbi:MAG: molybdopterin molybdotransferase MoeA [Rhodospirillales bacterium]|nr:molybdopterin molybdotransferase MoeA [Rhodospirillales bacterium]MCW8863038.1 molybdopterin molybdotransferase MoeA [Rhodospirillales bacterium]MCW9001720.1 molybdopterin molybdotransferase MoeA [Rhodospirillales bacterium]